MHWDEPFPLEAVPTRVRHAILKEFEGRHPSTGQIAAIPDSYWLSTPDIGPTSLETIRRVAGAKTQQTASPSVDSLTDAELLDRLQRLQDELRWLQDQLKARLSKAPGRTPNRYWHTTTPPNGADRQEAPQASGHTA